MEEVGIKASVLSLTAPGIDGWKLGEERTDIAQRVNNYGANLVKEHPDQFGYMATLPLPDIQASLHEIRRAYDELRVDGISLHSNYDGVYLADSTFDPVWEELNRCKATVFIHPTTPHGVKVLKGIPGPVEDYPADTTRCALDLAYAGHPSRFGATNIILSHGGGFLPYAASRFAVLKHSLTPAISAEEVTFALKSFYFDTALVAPTGLPSLLAFAPRGHVVFGSDYCYAPPAACVTFTHSLDMYEGYKDDELDQINCGALALFPRLNPASA